MINSRKKGHAYELDIRDLFKDLGFTDAVSSRSESKNRDDQGVDLCYTAPFNVQAKAVEKLSSIHDILARMPRDGNINTVFHKRNRKGTIVCMELNDFVNLIYNVGNISLLRPDNKHDLRNGSVVVNKKA
jgi:hypothetical protein